MICPHYAVPLDDEALTAVSDSRLVPTVWDPRYVTHAAPLTSTTKAGAVVEAWRHLLHVVPTPSPDDLETVWDHIATWHAPDYVTAVRTGTPIHRAESQGFRWSPAFADSVARIWLGQHVAHRLAHALGRIVLHPVSGAHHAWPHTGSGYCTFNYVVAALGLVLSDRPDARVAVIDLDAHYGDGTVAFVRQTQLPVHIFDVHGGRAGHEEVLESGQMLSFGVGNAREYNQALDRLPAFLDRHAITDAVYLAGVDPYEHDPVGGVAGMSAEALRGRDDVVVAALNARGIASVVNFAGGYVPDQVVALHGATIEAIRRSWTTER